MKYHTFKVLLVDDDRFFLEEILCPVVPRLVDDLMETENCSVDLIVAHDGTEGWEVYQKSKPDIVFTDFHMPNMNGKELAEKISQFHYQPKALFLVSNCPDSMVKGMTKYIDKKEVIDFFVKIKKESLKR